MEMEAFFSFKKNKGFPAQKCFLILSVCWFIINLLQAIFTEINADEAYYFLYGKYPAWGYFDHPPMVALLSCISAFFFKGNLGARFLTVLIQIPTLWLIWLQLDKKENKSTKDVFLFFAIAASMVMFAVCGFTATPDAPLLFFTALFLYAYKRFIAEGRIVFTILLSLSMAALVYTKYQGVLVIAFVVLSNIRLILRPRFLGSALLAMLFVLPHFYWQFSNEFPSFKYHLLDRADPFRWDYLLEYLPNQGLVFNPFTLFAVFYVLFKYRPKDLFERAQYFIILGLVFFFWATTFRGHAEPHWTVAASVPMMILLNNRIAADEWLRNYTRRIIAGSLLLVFIARILLVSHLLPAEMKLNGKAAHYRAIEKVAGNNPVVFTGSFQNPSLYTFFTGKPSTLISAVWSRKTQFELWHLENSWGNRRVFVEGIYEGRSKTYQVGNTIVNGFFTDGFQTTNQLKITFQPPSDSLKRGDTVLFSFRLENPNPQVVNMTSKEYPLKLQLLLFDHNGGLHDIEGLVLKELSVIRHNEPINRQFSFIVPDLPKGPYKLGFCFSSILGVTLNSDTKEILLY